MAFLIQVREDRERIPIAVRYAIHRHFDLLLGYDAQSWDFKALYHGVVATSLDRRVGGVLQLEFAVERSQAEIDLQEASVRRAGLDVFLGRPRESGASDEGICEDRPMSDALMSRTSGSAESFCKSLRGPTVLQPRGRVPLFWSRDGSQGPSPVSGDRTGHRAPRSVWRREILFGLHPLDSIVGGR